MTEQAELQAPSLPRRLIAMTYDLLLVIAVVAVVNALALGIQVKVLGSAQHELHPQLAQFFTVASIFGFFTLFWAKQGQTLGMQAWRIKLVDGNGHNPPAARCVLRCSAAILSAACLGLGYFWCLIDRRKRYWHDHLSGTELVLLPRDSGDRGAGA